MSCGHLVTARTAVAQALRMRDPASASLPSELERMAAGVRDAMDALAERRSVLRAAGSVVRVFSVAPCAPPITTRTREST